MSPDAARTAIHKVTTPAAPEPPSGLFSNCLVVGDQVYVSGQHAGIKDGVVGGASVLEQTREALRRVLALVEAAGGNAADVVKLTIYLTDINRKGEVSAARQEVFKTPFPCSTLIGVTALAEPELLVEIDAIAVRNAGRGKIE